MAASRSRSPKQPSYPLELLLRTGPTYDLVHHFEHEAFVFVAPGTGRLLLEVGEHRQDVVLRLTSGQVTFDHLSQILVP